MTFTKNNIQKKKGINHLIHSENKHIYSTLLINYYLYIYAFHNTLVSHNMNLLYKFKENI